MNNGSRDSRVRPPPPHADGNRLPPASRGLSSASSVAEPGANRRIGHPSVELHIGELSLIGFKPGDKHIVGDALQRELTRLLSENDVGALLKHEIELDRLNLDGFQVRPGMSPRTIGVEVAAAIFRRLTR
ncbi:MAG TPA: hypothetical protein VJX67_14980 [Blastocatellia bacterium]|nr:hypothetical protein [Blastocatellia bacterium]